MPQQNPSKLPPPHGLDHLLGQALSFGSFDALVEPAAKFLINYFGDEGVFLRNGVYGPGWYHYGTPKNDLFIGHDNATDFYIFDFNMADDGRPTKQGKDVVDVFEHNIDGWVLVDTQWFGGGATYAETGVWENIFSRNKEPYPDPVWQWYEASLIGNEWVTVKKNLGTFTALQFEGSIV